MNAAYLTLRDIAPEIMIDSNIRVIVTSNYFLCCGAPGNSVCLTKKPWYIKCSLLLPQESMGIAFIIISGSIVIINAKSILLYFLIKSSNLHKAFTAIAIFNNINNFLIAFYLTIIWISNLIMSKTFRVKQSIWNTKGICYLAFSTSLLFAILSQVIQFLMSFSRLMVVVHPLNSKYKEFSFVRRLLIYLLLSSCCLTILIVLIILHVDMNIGNNLCLPFIDQTGLNVLTKILIWIKVITESLNAVIIMCIHICIYTQKKKSGTEIRKSNQEKESNTPLIIQLIFITISNFLCWFPVNGIHIAAMFLSSYSPDLIIWAAVLGMPINALVIPFLFIILSLKKFTKSRKRV